jgi:hypothetical protein
LEHGKNSLDFFINCVYIYLKNLFWILNNLKFKIAQKVPNYFPPFYLLSSSDLQKNKIKKVYNLRELKKQKSKKEEVRRAHLHSCSFPWFYIFKIYSSDNDIKFHNNRNFFWYVAQIYPHIITLSWRLSEWLLELVFLAKMHKIVLFLIAIY